MTTVVAPRSTPQVSAACPPPPMAVTPSYVCRKNLIPAERATSSQIFFSVYIVGSVGTDGTIFDEMMDEGSGGFNMRQNFMQRSTDGGITWSSELAQGAPFSAAGRATCSDNSYYACMYVFPGPGYWKHQGFGQAGVGPDNVVHYAYTGGAPSDPGNIYYVRSTDSGFTWSAPLKLNSDATTRAQWGAALSVNAAGQVFVSWYD